VRQWLIFLATRHSDLTLVQEFVGCFTVTALACW